MVALNKVDLLPKEATPARLTQWVRLRLRAAGLPPADKVFCVSAAKGSGVQALVDGVRDALGFRGDLWVVGAQVRFSAVLLLPLQCTVASRTGAQTNRLSAACLIVQTSDTTASGCQLPQPDLHCARGCCTRTEQGPHPAEWVGAQVLTRALCRSCV
jgi:hypothetical protein